MKEVHRMARSRRIAWAIIMAIATAAMLGTAVSAADDGQKIGVVDVQRVLTDAPRVKQYKEELDVLRQSLSLKLEIRSQNLMLDENQIKELIDLKTKANATEQDKAKIKELTDVEKQRDEELKKLQGTAQPDEQQKARQKELEGMLQRSRSTGEALEKDYSSQFQTRAQELDAKATADFQEAVNKVAEARGLTLVVAKEAVFFGGANITDDIIAKLDRKMQ